MKTCISLFAGGGGKTLGAQQAGFSRCQIHISCRKTRSWQGRCSEIWSPWKWRDACLTACLIKDRM